MSWIMPDKEFENVLSLSASKRYAYFIKKVSDWKQIWSLRNQEGWVLAGDEQGNELVPVWPHERFASACAVSNWKECEPSLIELSVWLTRWIPGILNDRRLIAVFPTPSHRGIIVSPERLKLDLESELLLYE